MNRFNRGKANQGDTYFRAQNPPDGIILDYWVDPAMMQEPRNDAAQEPDAGADPAGMPSIDLDIFSSSGEHVRRLDVPQGENGGGAHRVVWDMRHATSFAGLEQTAGRSFMPPWVMPGEYEVRLSVGDRRATTIVSIMPDPLSEMSPAERRIWHDTLVALEKMAATSQAARTATVQIADAIASAEKAMASAPRVPAEIGASITGLSEKVADLSAEISRISRRVSQSYSSVHASTELPTADQSRIAQESYDGLIEQLGVLQNLIDQDLPALRAQLEAAGVPWSLRLMLAMPSMAPPPGR
jgi:hypothetical protein